MVRIKKYYLKGKSKGLATEAYHISSVRAYTHVASMSSCVHRLFAFTVLLPFKCFSYFFMQLYLLILTALGISCLIMRVMISLKVEMGYVLVEMKSILTGTLWL